MRPLTHPDVAPECGCEIGPRLVWTYPHDHPPMTSRMLMNIVYLYWSMLAEQTI